MSGSTEGKEAKLPPATAELGESLPLAWMAAGEGSYIDGSKLEM